MNASSIVQMMESAYQAGVKVPSIVFETGHGRVRFYRQTDRSKKPGSVSVNNGGPRGSDRWYGSIDKKTGDFRATRDCPASVVSLVDHFAADPGAFAATYGQSAGRCCFCATEITTDESLAVGYGPVCAANYGLPWGEKDAAPAPAREPQADLFEDAPQADVEDAFAAMERQAGGETVEVPVEPALDPLVCAGAELSFYAREVAAGRQVEASTLLAAADAFEDLVMARAQGRTQEKFGDVVPADGVPTRLVARAGA